MITGAGSYTFGTQQPYLNQYYQKQVPGLVQSLKGGTAPTLDTHLGNVMGNSRQLLDQYTQQAAGAGIQRGGMSVAGGAPLASTLAMQATKGLAGQYATDYANAAQMANADRASQQQLLSQIMGGITSSGGYNWDYGYGSDPRYSGMNWGLGSDQLQAIARARAKADLLVKHQEHLQRLAEQQAAQDRAWTMEQRSNQRFDRNQAMADQAYAEDRAAARQRMAAIQARPNIFDGGAQGISGSTSAVRPNSSQADQWQQFQQDYQKQAMIAQLQQQQQQARQEAMKTQGQATALGADQFKQEAWQRNMAPYLAALQANPGAPSYAYGGMNNQRLADAMRAGNSWAGYRQYK